MGHLRIFQLTDNHFAKLQLGFYKIVDLRFLGIILRVLKLEISVWIS